MKESPTSKLLRGSQHLQLTSVSRFILNGLKNANDILKETVFEVDDWEVVGEFVVDKNGGRHQAFYTPKKDVTVLNVQIEAGEKVQVEQSLKYSVNEAKELWLNAGLREVLTWEASSDSYCE